MALRAIQRSGKEPGIDCREVQKRAWDGSDRHTFRGSPVTGSKSLGAVHSDPGSGLPGTRCRHFSRSVEPRRQAPQPRRGPVAQQSAVSTAEDCGKSLSMARKGRMSDRVDALVNPINPSRLPRVPEGPLRIPEFPKLPHRNNPVLSLRQRRQLMVTSSFWVHTGY
jgi:hypothetical protein